MHQSIASFTGCGCPFFYDPHSQDLEISAPTEGVKNPCSVPFPAQKKKNAEEKTRLSGCHLMLSNCYINEIAFDVLLRTSQVCFQSV